MDTTLDSLGTTKAIAIGYKVVREEQRDSFIDLPVLALTSYGAANIAAQSASPTTVAL